MRTTLKRGVGRGAELNGNGHAVFPPEPVASVVLYGQPELPRRTAFGLMRRIVLGAFLVVLALLLGGVGGAYLWFHQSVAAVQAHSPAVKRAERQLHVLLPGHAAIALLLGNNQRAGIERSAGGRSDTIMLIRADPRTKTISMLSIPRDLNVPVYCPRSTQPLATTRIDYAFAYCGPSGSLDTVEKLTGLPINYLITVDYHGFKEIVDQLGGVWLNIDRRYYNRNVGTLATEFANIDLQPGYQRLGGGSALEFVRFRHYDSDFYRVAREQEFIRAIKQQIAQNFDPLNLPAIVSAITHNIEVGSKTGFTDTTVLQYALFAVTLPAGHVFQDYVSGTSPLIVNGADELQAPLSSIQQAVSQFLNPDVHASRLANLSALGEKITSKTPAPQHTTVEVLNGNGVAGAANNAAFLLRTRGYASVFPPRGAQPNAPTQTYFHTQVYFRPRDASSKAAAAALAKLVEPADVHPLPADPKLRLLDPGAMLMVVLGSTFSNQLPPVVATSAPQHQPPAVRSDPALGLDLLRPLVRRVPFTLESPTVVEQNSYPDALPGDVPVRLYWITRTNKAVVLVFRTGGNEFWDVEETNWTGAPILTDKSFRHVLGGREFELYYTGPHLHMAVLSSRGTTYWVENTLLDSLSNETMLAIAKGLKPVAR